jgi:hypothetical protein
MSRKRLSIAQIMLLIALCALNLAFLQALPRENLLIPTLWIFLAIPDFVIVWKLILRRECRAFHCTFLIVLLPTFIVLSNLTARESLRILHTLVWLFGGIVLDPRKSTMLFEAVHLGEFWLDAVLAVLLAWAAGVLAAWLERRRGWDIAAFWRGALVGLLAACALATIDDFILRKGQPLQGTFPVARRLAIVGSSMIVGGILGRSRLRSTGFSEARTSTGVSGPAEPAR